jgi:hypothetical protein
MTRHLALPFTAALALVALSPANVAAHQIGERYQAPLPLIAYVIGAAIAVAISFLFVILRNSAANEVRRPPEPRTVPGWLRVGLQAIGLLAWLWIVAQALFGGSSSADVASLFLWVYGWVGLALVSALIGPLWSWLDPFSTLHMIVTAAGRRIGLGSDEGEPAEYPARWGIWPAVIGFALVVWLELVARVEGGRSLGLLLIGYTFVTLAAMSYFGRDEWRRHGEIFSVWFGLLGRLAPFVLAGQPEEGRVRRQPLGSGLLGGGPPSERPGSAWSVAHVVLVSLGTGAIILDGLSQTQLYFDLFGQPPPIVGTVIAVAFMGLLVALVLGVASRLGLAAVGAGLLPVAVGYLIAHYFTFLLVDGQRILHALNDPLQRGDNLLPFDLGFFEPGLFLPTAIVWSIQLAAVVGGHVVGAWAGHSALVATGERADPLRQLPLAALMVLFTSVTLWSLGQAVIAEPETAVTRGVGVVREVAAANR